MLNFGTPDGSLSHYTSQKYSLETFKLGTVSVVRQVSRKVELLSTSATVAVVKKHFFVKLVSFAVAHKFQLKVSTCNGDLTDVLTANMIARSCVNP